MNPLLFGPIFDIIKQVLGRVLPDPEAQAKAATQALQVLQDGTFDQKAAQAIAIAQIDVNKQDAAGNWWQSGWRPAIGWVCAGALFSQYIVRPWVQWIGVVVGHPLPPVPGIDDQLWQLMGGMLGLGGLRTIEKIRGAA